MSARAVALLRPRAGLPQWRATALVCAWCALCILFAQALGLVHGIAHGPIHANVGAQAAQAVGAHTEVPHHAHPGHAPGNAQVAPGTLETLFPQHEDAEDCRLFDALGQQPGAAMAGPVPPPAVPPCMQRLRRLEGAFVARWATLFDARGPPLSH